MRCSTCSTTGAAPHLPGLLISRRLVAACVLYMYCRQVMRAPTTCSRASLGPGLELRRIRSQAVPTRVRTFWHTVPPEQQLAACLSQHNCQQCGGEGRWYAGLLRYPFLTVRQCVLSCPCPCLPPPLAVAAPYFSSSVLGGRQQLVAKQCSARGGTLHLDLGSEPGRVVVAGTANMGGCSELDTEQL